MAYRDFTPEQAVKELGLTIAYEDLFPELAPLPVPAWLQEALRLGMQLPRLTQKARNEFIVAPILLACRELSQDAVASYSGLNLDADFSKGLVGPCDFILSRSQPFPMLVAPLVVTIVQARDCDIELAVGQGVAQMVGAQLFNEKKGKPISPQFGCVTYGDIWQFLSLEGSHVGYHSRRYFISQPGAILAVFQAMIAACLP